MSISRCRRLRMVAFALAMAMALSSMVAPLAADAASEDLGAIEPPEEGEGETGLTDRISLELAHRVQVNEELVDNLGSQGAVLHVRDDGTRSVLQLDDEVEIEEAWAIAEDLVERGIARHAEPDGRVGTLKTPTDPLWPHQWGPSRIGMPDAWATTTGGSPGPVVAVVDTGVNTVTELGGRLLPGRNVIDGSSDVTDSNGHGTLTATVIAAAGNNDIGFAGQCWTCRVLPVKALGDNGSGYTSDLAEGIRWAADNGAAVINVSAGGYHGSTTLANAVKHAASKGALVVASAGNEGLNTSVYPARYGEAVSVGASDKHDKRAVWSDTSASNFGSTVDIAAPGCTPAQDQTGEFLLQYCGTSASAPLVSGLAALVIAREGPVQPYELRRRLRDTSHPVAWVSSGVVRAGPFMDPPSVVAPSLTATSGDRVIRLDWSRAAGGTSSSYTYRLYRSTGSSCSTSSTLVGTTSERSFLDEGLASGRTYRYCVTASDGLGTTSPRSNVASATTITFSTGACSGHAFPLTGDWDGIGRSGIGWWCDGRTRLRTAEGLVYEFRYGRSGDVPVVADWNGDGQDTVSVIRDGTWHVNNRRSGGTAERTFLFGRVTRGDVPLTGDWDGKGRSLPAIVRDREWHLRLRQSGGPADISFIYGRLTRGDLPLWGDWNGKGTDNVAIVRDGDWHFRTRHSGGAADFSYRYGRVLSGDSPVVGDWNGDRKHTPGIVRGSDWHLKDSHGGGSADRVIRLPQP